MSPEKRNRLDLFTHNAQQLLATAEAYAKYHKHHTIGAQHVFLSCFTDTSIAYEFIASLGLDLITTVYRLMSAYPERAVGVVQPKLSTSLEATITLAIAEARRLNHTHVTTAHLLIAMLIRYEPWLRETLAPVGLSNRVLIALLHQVLLTESHPTDDPLPTEAERERLQLQKKLDTSSVIPTMPERIIRQLRAAIGLPPLKPRSSFTIIDYLTAIIDVMPNCAVLYTYRANRLLHRRKYLEAAVDCSQALSLKPYFAGAYFHRASAYQEAGDFDRSLKDYEEVRYYAPNNWRLYVQRGFIWLRRDEYDKAFEDFNRVLSLITAQPQALSGRASVRLSKREFQWAISDYDQVLSMLPNDYRALYGRGTAKVYQGDLNGAQRDFYKLSSLYSHNSYVQSSLGWLALHRREYDKAIQYCKRAIEIDPNNGAAHYSRGASRSALQDVHGAVADFKRSLKLWTTVDVLLTAHIGQEMRDYLRQHDRLVTNVADTGELSNDGG